MEAKQHTSELANKSWKKQKRNKKCIETSENETVTTQTLWDSVKAVLRGRFIAIQACLKKQDKNKINNLTLHLK